MRCGAVRRGAVRRGAAAGLQQSMRAGTCSPRFRLLLLACRGGVRAQSIEHRQVGALRRLAARLASDGVGHVLSRREEAAHLTMPRAGDRGR